MTEPRAMKDGPDFPFMDTAAAIMLKGGFQRQKARGVSLRAIAKRLNYAQATVLSHMANGRVPVPIERAVEIAREVGLDEGEFLAAAVEQRAPGARDLLVGGHLQSFDFVTEVKMLAGTQLDELSAEQKSIIREVAADPQPGRRWLSIAEVQTVALIRQAKPSFRTHGLTPAELGLIQAELNKAS